MSVSTLHLIKNKINHLVEENTIVNKVYIVTKKTLDYLVQHKYAIAVSIWSYVAIEVGVAAAEMSFGVDYIYDVDSCREVLCSYWNNNSNIIENSTTYQFQNRCNSPQRKSQSYSLVKCLEDLCNYINALGEEFYACSDNSQQNKLLSSESEILNPTWNSLKKACPVRHFRSLDNLKRLRYINRCIKKLCASAKEFPLDLEFIELCKTKSVSELYKVLANINKSIRELKKTSNSDPLAQTTAIFGLIGALAGLVSGAAGVATTIITYRATKTATSVLSQSIPCIQEGMKNIAKATLDTTMATIRETASQVGEMIPMETLHVLQELSETLEKQSIYYSFEKTPGDVSLQNSNTDTGGSSGGETQVESIGTGGSGGTGSALMGTVVLGGISVLSNSDGKSGSKGTIDLVNKVQDHIPEILKKTIVAITSSPEEKNVFSDTIDQNCAYYEDPLNKDPYHITIESIDCLRSSLLNWDNSFCFYQRSIDFFACRFPLLRHQLESSISFFVMELHKFFSENRSTLCHFSHEDLWCNWNKFLDSISSNRTIAFFNDEDCPWDQFALKLYKIANDTYRMEAIGQCYNETGWIKI